MRKSELIKLSRFNEWFRPKGFRAFWVTAVILTLIVGVHFLVYLTGGTTTGLSHTMYLPIFLAALFFRVPGGIIAGIIGGLILGPIMPLNVHTEEMQITIRWVYRLCAFSLTGAVLGYMANLLDRQFKRIEWQYYHNPLTGLPNRTYLEYKLDQTIREMNPGQKSAVLLFNLFNFDEICETFGMENSITILNQLADRVGPLIYDGSICELVPSLLGLVVTSNNIDQKINETLHILMQSTQAPFSIGEVPIFLDICTGIAVFPDHDTIPSRLIRKARTAAITAHAKSLDYWMYEKSLDILKKERIELLGSVKAAIKKDQFKVFYQPILNLSTGEVAGLEALIRWQHPERGLIPPADFIHLLESTSLIFSFQEWLIDTVFNQIRTWNSQGYPLSCSINLSARGLNYLRLEKPINKILDNYDISPNQVMFEITESVVMLDPQESQLSLGQIKEAGFKLAIDDFGTGYSSLNYLKNLPVDYLKIDLYFIRELDRSEKDQEIVRAILTSARALGLNVIAEGIENRDTLKWLKMEECGFGQGYLFDRPMPAELVPRWVDQFSFATVANNHQER